MTMFCHDLDWMDHFPDGTTKKSFSFLGEDHVKFLGLAQLSVFKMESATGSNKGDEVDGNEAISVQVKHVESQMEVLDADEEVEKQLEKVENQSIK